MKFEEARFKNFLSELGLPSSYKSVKNIIIFQGTTDTVLFGTDLLKIEGGDIKSAFLSNKSPKLTFQELEEAMTISQKIKNAGFPPLELKISPGSISGSPITNIPAGGSSDKLVGLPASPGKVTANCLVYPTNEIPNGKIVVLKNSKDLHLLMKHKPAGIILEEGNLLSHASILAREAGIPAIVKVADATKILKSGEEIHLDAFKGLITIPRLR